ncbi:DUF2382 domain-containing protein [Azospirillum doebereinerae]|uniref:DUF2382 domain-containing protein n=1 Tax=Azospirillum doebereinerae TaxID=92933 RepID=UPI001EE61C9C|nr:DUF2382 domain-containing protein [Azospirillum doebereinerae]MCG5242251.1 DUF2382 domain-containing protein [Azospirillum doebereinerae]
METGPTEERVIVPLAEEHVTVHKTVRASGGVRVRKTVQETFQDIDETVTVQDVTVERVPIGRWIDQPMPERQEGDTTVIPIIEEVAVIETRLRLVEEIRVTRSESTRPLRTAVPVRREQVVVEDVSADGTVTNRPATPRPAPPQPAPPQSNDSRATPTPAPALRRTPMTTIIGLFTESNAASKAHKAILALGGQKADVRVFESGSKASAEDLRYALSGLEIEDKDIKALTGALERGALIVSALVSADQTDAVTEAMTDNGAQGTDVFENPEADTLVLPEVEETMGVAKTAVTSGIRATTKVTERPVQQTVTLTEETVQARRREVDRDLSPQEAETAFQEKTIEVTGVSEEAEIRKAARLIGEVEITKNSQQRKETVRDTVRKTEVETHKTGPRR